MVTTRDENDDDVTMVLQRASTMSPEAIQASFLMAAETGSTTVIEIFLDRGAKINEPDIQTGLTALHLAVGRDSLRCVQLLIERGALFLPDDQGRMPSTLAAEYEVSEEMCDLIVEAEAKATIFKQDAL